MLERPNTQFAIYRSPTVGDNQAGGISAMQLPGTRIRGVIVDNPSGSWVKLSGTGLGFEPFIAPYTLAWSVSLLPSVLEIGASYVAGPTGQPMSTAGSPIVVYLFEAQVPSSGGSAFVVPTSETQNATIQAVITDVGDTLVLLGGVPTVKIRVFLATLAYDPTSVAAGLNADSGCIVELFDGATQFASLYISPEHPSDVVQFPTGNDLSVGASLVLVGQTLFGTIAVKTSVVYGVV